MIKKTIKHTQKLAIAISVLTGLSGCWWNRAVNPENSWFPGGGNRVTTAGAVQMIEPGFENIDLINLLDSYNAYHSKYQECEKRGGAQELIDGCKIDMAFSGFQFTTADESTRQGCSGIYFTSGRSKKI